MDFEQIRYDVVDGAATITLNRPELLNALTVKMMQEWHEAVKMADADPEVRDAIEASSKPAIGKINGFCFTGALELALVFDFIVVAEEAKLGDTHAKWGLRPTWGMSARLADAVGVRKARELSYTARTFTGRQAAEWGLANYAVPLEELDAAVKQITDGIASCSPGAVTAFKDLYGHWLTGSVDDALKYEESTEYEITDTADRLGEFAKK
jgi:enoyl-CoA hydratase/carnithine racemase